MEDTLIPRLRERYRVCVWYIGIAELAIGRNAEARPPIAEHQTGTHKDVRAGMPSLVSWYTPLCENHRHGLLSVQGHSILYAVMDQHRPGIIVRDIWHRSLSLVVGRRLAGTKRKSVVSRSPQLTGNKLSFEPRSRYISLT
jgi:hypothetical protein